jgi:hypothetical protein
MEEQIKNPASNGIPKFVLPTVVAALIVFAAIGFYIYRQNNNNSVVISPSKVMMPNQNQMGPKMMQTRRYKNGTYSDTGNYISPGGPREINATITLAYNVIIDATAQGTATDATSKRFQGEFVANFKSEVVGKNIDEVVLTKVSGSSLTPKGFNDALDKIKAVAKA